MQFHGGYGHRREATNIATHLASHGYVVAAPDFQLAIVEGAGHVHFTDNAEVVHEHMRQAYLSGSFPDPEIDAIALGTAMRPFAELLSQARGHDVMCGLALAHMDANLKDHDDARAFLDGDLAGILAARDTFLEVSRNQQTVSA